MKSPLKPKNSEKKKAVAGKAPRPESLYAEEAYCQVFLKKMRRILVLSISCSVIAFLTVMMVWATKPEQRYYPVENGVIVPHVALNQPINNSDQVLSWISSEVRQIFSFDFINYQSQLENKKNSFTSDGWLKFAKALQESRLVHSVRERRQIIVATPMSAPRILEEGVISGRYAWKIEQEFLFSFYAGNSVVTQKSKVETLVVRVPTHVNPTGLAIHQLIQG